jgi:hypothetical protein
VLVELQKSVECGICLDFLFDPIVGCCGHSFCASCIGAMLSGGARTCPVCRGDFGELRDRPHNILVRSLILHYFPVEYERKRLRQKAPQEEGTAEGGLVLRPRLVVANNNNNNAVLRRRDRDEERRGWLRAVVNYLRPLWPMFRFAPVLVYPLFLFVMFWMMFRGSGGRRRRRV